MRSIHITVLCLLLTGSAAAQNLRMERAAAFMRDWDYISAIGEYQQVLQENELPEAKINLAECYRKINDRENALYWYEQVVQLREAKPVHGLYYGMMLQAAGRCAEARQWFERYHEAAPDDYRGNNLLQACDQAAVLMQKNSAVYTIYNLPVNSAMDDYAPGLLGNKLIFASDRDKGLAVKRTNMWTGTPFSELYRVDFQPLGGQPGRFRYKPPEKFSETVNSKLHEAGVSFSPDGQTVYFTRNNIIDGKTGRSEDDLVKLKIFYGNADGQGEWTNLQSLSFDSDEYSVAHPSVSADGKRLYFASNKPGGFGGMDLYYSEWIDGRWDLPVNLGPVVNTEGNELFPFIDPSNRLYFASNSHIGLGGLDIYYSSELQPGQWQTPVNPGYPVNSTYDDFGMVTGPDPSWGFFSSDRPGGVGKDDIYGFQKLAAPVEILVADTDTREPMPGVRVRVDTATETLQTGADGRTAFDLKSSHCATILVEADGFFPVNTRACAEAGKEAEVIRLTVNLKKIPVFAIRGIVFDMYDGLPAEGALVSITSDCGRPAPEPFWTSADGRYTFRLDSACCYTVIAEKNGYVTAIATEKCTRGLQRSFTIDANLNLLPFRSTDKKTTKQDKRPLYNPQTGQYETPEGAAASYDFGNGQQIRDGKLYSDGKSVQPGDQGFVKSASGSGFLLHLYYDFDQAALRDESVPELNKLLQLLRNNPAVSVEIAAHTDARGSDSYNLDLSQRRAEAVSAWLQHRGIDARRLIAKGYGETQPLNHCVNGTDCTEQQHQMNRRTEFHILGDPAGLGNSRPGNNVKVGPCAGCPF